MKVHNQVNNRLRKEYKPQIIKVLYNKVQYVIIINIITILYYLIIVCAYNLLVLI